MLIRIVGVSQNTVLAVQYRTNAGKTRLCACTVLLLKYGIYYVLYNFELLDQSVLQQTAEVNVGIQRTLIEPRRNSKRLFNRLCVFG